MRDMMETIAYPMMPYIRTGTATSGIHLPRARGTRGIKQKILSLGVKLNPHKSFNDKWMCEDGPMTVLWEL